MHRILHRVVAASRSAMAEARAITPRTRMVAAASATVVAASFASTVATAGDGTAACKVSAPAAKKCCCKGTAAVAAPKPSVLFVLGGPGAGKGTQCAKLVEEYGYVHLSAGDLLREERASGSPDAELIESFIREGKIVPVEITVKLLKKAMAKSGGSKFLVDGFPRNHDNLDGWHRVVGDEANVLGVLMYDCPEAVMEGRLLERGKTSGRSDDKADVIRKRFHTYVESTMPIINHYAAQGKCFKVVSDKPVDAVFEETKRLLEPLVAAEALNTYQLLVDARNRGDAATLTRYSHPAMTSIVNASAFRLRDGADTTPATTKARVAHTRVKLLDGKTALVVAQRNIETGGSELPITETVVLKYEGGRWQQVHVHESLMGFGMV